MQRRQLPIGIQSFRRLREKGCYYVDKTLLIAELIDRGEHYFLSRPRRFGKSMLIDTLRELFSGNEPLFRGLGIHDRWDWNETHPVVRLSFDGVGNEPGNLAEDIHAQLQIVESNAGLDPPSSRLSGPARLRDLLNRLHNKTGRQVVVLVDEYDKPILDVLDKPDMANANREYLRGFYGVIKGAGEHVRFVFVTGVSIFTKGSLFSGLNNLKNISLDPTFASICGYTDHDLDVVFSPELDGLDRDEIRRWYNGYHWLGEEDLYNPYDILLLFSDRVFKAYWYETGTPQMLYQKIRDEKRNPMELERLLADESLLSSFELGNVDLRALMFQAGYLTIIGEELHGRRVLYQLGYPNLEVRESMTHGLLEYATRRVFEAEDHGEALAQLLATEDFEGFGERLQAYLAGVPHQWYDSSQIERFEAHYASMLYLGFRAIGADLVVEDASSYGRADMVVFLGGKVFVLEFKMAEKGEAPEEALDRALTQMRDRGYADKYRDRGASVHLVAAVFGREQRNLLALGAELP